MTQDPYPYYSEPQYPTQYPTQPSGNPYAQPYQEPYPQPYPQPYQPPFQQHIVQQVVVQAPGHVAYRRRTSAGTHLLLFFITGGLWLFIGPIIWAVRRTR